MRLAPKLTPIILVSGVLREVFNEFSLKNLNSLAELQGAVDAELGQEIELPKKLQKEGFFEPGSTVKTQRKRTWAFCNAFESLRKRGDFTVLKMILWWLDSIVFRKEMKFVGRTVTANALDLVEMARNFNGFSGSDYDSATWS